MSQSSSTLDSKVRQIQSKAEEYETATNFEAKKQQYLNDLSSIESSLGRLQRRVERMEFRAEVLTNVLEASTQLPPEVDKTRRTARTVAAHDPDYYYELVDHEEIDQYEQRVQQALADAESAIESIETELRSEERDWKERVESARNVQRLFGDSRDMSSIFNEIEAFVGRRMWDDSESVTTLQSDWQALQKNWERSGIDWETFQRKYGLSQPTVDILKDLAKGNDVELRQLDAEIAKQLVSVGDLQNVVKLTI